MVLGNKRCNTGPTVQLLPFWRRSTFGLRHFGKLRKGRVEAGQVCGRYEAAQSSNFPGGLETLPVADTELLEASTGYKTLVEREQGKFIYPAVKVAFKASNTEGALQNEEVTCQYGGVQYKDGAVLSMRLMYVDLGPISIKNPLVYKEDGFQGWVKQGIEEWAKQHDMTPTTHWKHFLDRSIKVLEWEGTD